MSTFVGRRIPAATVRVRRDPLRVPLGFQLLWAFLKLLVKVVLIVAGSPVIVGIFTAVTLAWAIWRLAGFSVLVCAVLFVAAVLVGVRVWWPDRYNLWIHSPLRSRWRRWSIYRYKWPATMDLAELSRYRHDGSQYEPRLLTVKSNADGEVVRARMLAGQVVNDWGKVSDRLCQTFGAYSCRVRPVPGQPHDVELWFLTHDTLQEIIEPAEPETPVSLAGVPIGRREDGQPYRLPLLGHNGLLSGAMGAGKSSVEWAIIHALAPAIRDRSVRLWGIDPKRMELAYGESLFEQLVCDFDAIADLLEDAVTVMRDRQGDLRGFTRQHIPSPDAPLLVLLIDELAALSYITDRDLKRRIDAALALLLSQGRAVGVSVIGCVQDPRKEVIPQRGLYTCRIALRLTEADEVALVLGRGAWERGARCDEIPESLPGVAFVQVDGVAEPDRVRFAYVTDDDIRALAATQQPPRLSLVPNDPTDLESPVEAPDAA